MDFMLLEKDLWNNIESTEMKDYDLIGLHPTIISNNASNNAIMHNYFINIQLLWGIRHKNAFGI